jgi:hypothetical protein
LGAAQVAGIEFCATGAMAGIFFAWMDSPFRPWTTRNSSSLMIGGCEALLYAV